MECAKKLGSAINNGKLSHQKYFDKICLHNNTHCQAISNKKGSITKCALESFKPKSFIKTATNQPTKGGCPWSISLGTKVGIVHFRKI